MQIDKVALLNRGDALDSADGGNTVRFSGEQHAAHLMECGVERIFE